MGVPAELKRKAIPVSDERSLRSLLTSMEKSSGKTTCEQVPWKSVLVGTVVAGAVALAAALGADGACSCGGEGSAESGKDGFIDEMENHLNAMDANGDDSITRNEYLAYLNRPGVNFEDETLEKFATDAEALITNVEYRSKFAELL